MDLVQVGLWALSASLGAGAVYAVIRERLANIAVRTATLETELAKVREHVHQDRNAAMVLSGRVSALEERTR